MKAVIQRVSNASVFVSDIAIAGISKGYLILVGIGHDDDSEDIEWLSKKIINLRIFGDKEGQMNHSINEVHGDILVVSQFTLHAKTKKGNRPSYIQAAAPEIAIPLYEDFICQIEKDLGKKVQSGKFGANMQVNLTNDGPVTIILDTKQKE